MHRKTSYGGHALQAYLASDVEDEDPEAEDGGPAAGGSTEPTVEELRERYRALLKNADVGGAAIGRRGGKAWAAAGKGDDENGEGESDESDSDSEEVC